MTIEIANGWLPFIWVMPRWDGWHYGRGVEVHATNLTENERLDFTLQKSCGWRDSLYREEINGFLSGPGYSISPTRTPWAWWCWR